MENRTTPLRADTVNIIRNSETVTMEPLKSKVVNACADSTPDMHRMKEIRARFTSPTDSFLSPCTQLLGKSHLSHAIPMRQSTKLFDDKPKENILQDKKGDAQ